VWVTVLGRVGEEVVEQNTDASLKGIARHDPDAAHKGEEAKRHQAYHAQPLGK
jgi:hypothetical protein